MNIQQIRDRYDPENDAHPVTWLEMQLAEELHKTQYEVAELQHQIHDLRESIWGLIGNQKLKNVIIEGMQESIKLLARYKD